MSTRINTNLDSLRGLLNLQKSNALQSQALQRLSTGTQINSAADNPSGLIESNTLSLQISAINSSIGNSNLANNVIGTADAALSQVDSLLNEIRGLVQQGVNSGALSQAQIQANQSQVDSALSAINRISSNTQFAGENLLDGSKGFTTVVSSTDAPKLTDYQVNQALFGGASSITIDTQVITAASQGQLTYNGGTLTGATTLQVSGAKGSQVLFFGNGTTEQNIADAVNANSGATGVTASFAAGTGAATATGSFFDGSIGSGTSAVSFQTKNSNVTVQFVNAGANQSQAVSVNGNAITVNLATDANGNVTGAETANAIATAINGNASAAALVTATGGGTGVVAGAASPTAINTNDSSISFTGNTNATVNFVVSGTNTAQSISVNGNAITVNLATDANGNVTSAETASTIAAAINGNATAAALVTATAAGDGSGLVGATQNPVALTQGAKLQLTSSDFGSSQFVGVQVLNGTFQTQDSTGANSFRSVGSDIVARINGQTATGNGLQASISTSLLDTSVTFAQASNVAGTDAKVTVTGGGSLFQIGANVSVAGQIGVGIDSVNTATLGGEAGKLYQLGSGGGKSLLDVGQNGVTGTNLVDIINQALSRVDTLRARLGALQKDVIQTNIDSLGVALQNITDAKSQISDTDFAATTAQLTQSQILSQAGISVLQIANQAPQQVLKLLG